MSDNPPSVADLLESFRYSPAPESPKPGMDWLQGGERCFGHFIGGEFTESSADFEVRNPATDEVLGRFTQGDEADVAAAYAAAEAALPNWRATPAFERARILYNIERLILQFRRPLEVLESMNNGKPFRESRLADVPLMARHFGHHATLAITFEQMYPNRRPLGVVGAVIPWNFPGLMATWKVAPVIAAGNTLVLKPGDTTPVTAMYLAEIFQRAGLPPGVVNIVMGDRETGKLVFGRSTPAKKFMFTGSTAAGKAIRQATAGSGKKLTMELGGKSPIVIFDDADIDSAVEAVVRSILLNKGEVCCACSRVLVQEGIAKRFVRRLKKRFSRIIVGDSLDKSTDVGAMNSRAQFEKVTGLIDLARKTGVDVWQSNCELPDGGFFIRPTILTQIQPDHHLMQEEIFGPVVAVTTFTTTARAIALANNTRYGLACAVFSSDVGKANWVASKINAGTRWINCVEQFDAAAGFGGTRESGFGREGGFEGMFDVTVEGPEPIAARHIVEDIEDDADLERKINELLGGWSPLDYTLRFLVGGKTARPDGAACFQVLSSNGEYIGGVGDANRKDVRNAAKAAFGAKASWATAGGDLRRKILMYMAEKVERNALKLAREISMQTGNSLSLSMMEVRRCVKLLFHWASWAVNFGGTVQTVAQGKMQVVATNEPIGVIGIRASDDEPLVGLIGAIAPALAMGNTVVVVAGYHPLSSMSFVEIVQNSDVPAGVLNILTARDPDTITINLTRHGAVDALWCFGGADDIVDRIEHESASNLKRTWCPPLDTLSGQRASAESLEFLRHATQVHNTWTRIGA